MLSPRDLEAVWKFAPLLAILLFTGALMMHLQMFDEHSMPTAESVVAALDAPLLEGVLTNSSPVIQVFGWGLVYAGPICVTLFVMWFVKTILVEIHIQIGYYVEVYGQANFYFLEIVSLACIMAGFVFIVMLLFSESLSLFNLLWYSGLFCYGLYLLGIALSFPRR